MQVLLQTSGEIAVVTLLTEQLEASNADEFRAAIDPVIEKHRGVVLDLNRVKFVDSRGCGAILSCLRGLTEKGGDLRLCEVKPVVRGVFDLIRLPKVCAIHGTAAEAVQSFA